MSFAFNQYPFLLQHDHTSRLKRQNMAFDEHTAQLDAALLQQLGAVGSDDEDEEQLPIVKPTPNQCYHKISLSGPHSPLETRVFGAYGNAKNQTVSIEPHSVNSIILDDRSQVC